MNKQFTISHQWSTAFCLIKSAETDQERAIAVGYISHLYIDVIAHNHFVPAHEAIWFEQGMCGHILSEWAMDGHLQAITEDSVSQLLKQHKRELSSFLSEALNLSRHTISNSINQLMFWDKLLRRIRLPQLIHYLAHKIDARTHRNFSYYLAQTHIALQKFQHVLQGQEPKLQAELHAMDEFESDYWRGKCIQDLALLNPQALQHF